MRSSLIAIVAAAAALTSCKGQDDAATKSVTPTTVAKTAAGAETTAAPAAPTTTAPGKAEVGKIVPKSGDEGGDEGVSSDAMNKEPTASGLDAATLSTALVAAGTLALGAPLVDAYGQATGADIESLSYRISDIEICESLDVNGPNFSNPQNCLGVFREAQKGDYDHFGYAEAKADTTNYIDLLSKTDAAKLATSVKLTKKDAHAYRYGFVYWYKPIKVKATVPLFDGSGDKMYTKDGPVMDVSGKLVSKVSNITTAPAEEAIAILDNGGAWFRFGKDFTITNADIDAKAELKLDLTFDPDGVITGAKGSNNGAIWGAAGAYPASGDPTPIYTIEVPMLAITPVTHKADDHVVKEQYLAHFVNGTIKQDYRVSLYYLESDPDKSIYGVDIQSIYVANSTFLVPASFQALTITESQDHEVTLKNNRDYVPFTGFKRLAAAGDMGSLTFKSQDGGLCAPGDSCAGNASYGVKDYAGTYELVGVHTLR